MFTTRRMEHGTPLLVDFDLGALVGAQKEFERKDPAALARVVKVLSVAGKAKAIRRLAAVAKATEDELRAAETDPAVMEKLEEEAAGRPFVENLREAIIFFGQWGRSFATAPDSSESEPTARRKKASPRGSRSADS